MVAGGNAGEMLVQMLQATDPVSLLVERSRELSLTDDQVRDLQTLRRETRQRNRPLLDTIERVAGSIPMDALRPARRREESANDSTARGRDDGLSQMPDTVRALVRTVRQNHGESRERAMAILTEDQRARVTELEESARRDMGRGGRGGSGGRGRRPPGS
jgi:hypothetical protein